MRYKVTDMQNSNEVLTKEKGLNLYTTLSIFTVKAPKLINAIEEAATAENMEEIEDHATKLIVYSNNAQLEGFTQRIKNLIIAARENKIHIAQDINHISKDCIRHKARFIVFYFL